MIDYDVFDATYGDFGGEMIGEIIDIYLGEHEERFKVLHENIVSKDLDALGKNAHSLKGATAVLYDDEVTELARQLELKGKNNDDSGLEELFEQLKKGTDRLIEDLKQLKEKYS
jgi:HPt (histidine-containing phosphotransfer) domain-containing protein